MRRPCSDSGAGHLNIGNADRGAAHTYDSEHTLAQVVILVRVNKHTGAPHARARSRLLFPQAAAHVPPQVTPPPPPAARPVYVRARPYSQSD